MPRYRIFTPQENNFTGFNDNDCFQNMYNTSKNNNTKSASDYLERKVVKHLFNNNIKTGNINDDPIDTCIYDCCSNKINVFDNYDDKLKYLNLQTTYNDFINQKQKYTLKGFDKINHCNLSNNINIYQNKDKNINDHSYYIDKKVSINYIQNIIDICNSIIGENVKDIKTSNYIFDINNNNINVKWTQNYDIYNKLKNKNYLFDISDVSCLCSID